MPQIAIEKALEQKGAGTSSSKNNSSNPVNSMQPTSSSSRGSGNGNGNANNQTPSHNQGSHRTNSVELRQDLNGINQVISKQKSAVKSGSAGAFNPSMFVQHTPSSTNDEPEDGVFVDRTTHDLLIEQVCF